MRHHGGVVEVMKHLNTPITPGNGVGRGFTGYLSSPFFMDD